MRAGLLSEIITIKRRVTTTNESGQKEHNYEKIRTTRARVIYTAGNRTIENKDIVWDYQYKFEVWDYVDVTEKDLIEYDSKEYRIKSINHDKKQQKLIITTELITE
jgi:SPP1 family predicted phage head-tail adaptor